MSPADSALPLPMPALQERSNWPLPEYHAQAIFHAPLAFAFRWCTDFRPNDGRLEGEEYERRVLERSRRKVVYEDLEETKSGWSWARYVVWLQPPARWHAESFGNHRNLVADYRLTELPGGRTRFDLWYRRRPSVLPFQRVPKKDSEAETNRAWRRFGQHLDQDFRASSGSRNSRSRGPA
jgi:hypothetical protein